MRALSGLLWVAVLVSPGLAGAQDGQTIAPGEGLEEEARGVFEAGRAAFVNGRFEVALERFLEAYELSPHPLLLFNIGIAAERLRHDAQAIEAFEGYLAARPDANNRREVEGRLRLLRERDASAQAASEPEEEQPHARSETSGGRILTWISLGVGIAAVGTGTALAVVTNNDHNDLVEACQDVGGCTDAEVDAGWDERSLTAKMVSANVLLGVGVVALGLAAVFFFVESGGDAEEGPTVGIGPGGVLLRGRL